MRHYIFIVMVLALGPSGVSAASPSGAAQQVCADIMAQYGIAPEGCDPDQDARVEAVTPDPVAVSAPVTTATAVGLSGDMLENHIFFPAGGDGLDPDARAQLDLLTEVLLTNLMSDACLRLTGHSDTSGPADLNHKIALKRAEAVAAYLGPGLGDPGRIEIIQSAGEDEPIPGFDGEDARNRRVQIDARQCPLP